MTKPVLTVTAADIDVQNTEERRRGPVVRCSLWTRPARVQSPGWDIIRCKNLALYIRDCESLCLSDETLKVVGVGPFYLVSVPGEVQYAQYTCGWAIIEGILLCS